MKYFTNCTTLDQVKDYYRRLAKDNHPDMGGDTATMQEINKEYAYISAQILNGAAFTKERREQEMRFTEIYREVLAKIQHLPGITIEVVGLWIWVTGLTKPVREDLKNAGFHFASKKVAWYYRADEYKVLRGGKKSLDEIRAKYGSQKVYGKSNNLNDSQ